MTTIPRTTLVCVDCQFPALAARALILTLEQCDYPAVRFLTDARPTGLDPRIRVVPIPRIASAAEYSRILLKGLLDHVETDFVQIVQWDGYVISGEAWQDAFFDYDYIGARWWHKQEGRKVGNGGFSLRSRRLLEALLDDEIRAVDAEDKVICLVYRDFLEKRHGIRIAPTSVANRYAFEGGAPSGREFGFHGFFNLPYFTGENELARVLASLPDEKFGIVHAVSLVKRLIRIGRKREALRCAVRIRNHGKLAANFKEELVQLMHSLVAPNEPCPCGSGSPYERCCGEGWQG